ncbi:uncharacterized protein LOC113293950 [Papaver somniferum]|uniref:uncharacterized protein LOC113293950 n=1 Tax=Papaver somniferum TaxID=3469 RepID=UPI000E701F41|nr:uncharacterized protein LOC113293950 [Papaver somniferum]
MAGTSSRSNNDGDTAMAICKSILGAFFGLCGLMLLSLVLRPSNPECYIEKLYIPPLDKASSSNDSQIINSTSIDFDLTFSNSDDVAKFFYVDTINMTFYYCGNNLSLAIANMSLPKFNLAHKGAAHRVETIEAFGVP